MKALARINETPSTLVDGLDREEDWSYFFAPAWQERVLNGPPPIPYLHMTEIRSSSWRIERGLSRAAAEDRVDEAFSIIDTMGSFYPIGVYLDAGHVRDSFAEIKVVKSSGGAKPFDPDYLCFLTYAYAVLSYLDLERPEAEKVDFIVEQKGHITKYIEDFHSTLADGLTALGSPSLACLVGKLIPGEKDRIPLQAADLLCWYSARKPGTMEAGDRRRYSKIAHRKGSRIHLTNDLISKMKATFS